MARANYDHLIPQIKADFRTGYYSVRKLADKHKVSVGFISKHTKGIEPDQAEVVNAGVAYKSALAGDNEHLVNAVRDVVDEKTKHLIFFNNSALKNQSLSNKKLSDGMSIAELESHSRITARNKETVLGKQPDTAIQINNNQAPQKIERIIVDANASD